MKEDTIHKILIVESSDDLKIRIKDILASNGFELTFVSSGKDALTCLDECLPEPFSLIISGYQMPVMKGDMILAEAKKHSPDTQRMLLSDSSNIKTIINAINNADIKSCLSLPFNDNELISQVKDACKQFDRIHQKTFLIKVTEDQNKQLYKIARNFKNQEQLFHNEIEEKVKKINILKQKLASKTSENTKKTPVTLEQFLDKRGVPALPENFVREFIFLMYQTKKVFTTSMAETFLELVDIDYEFIAKDTGSESNYSDLIETILPYVFIYVQNYAAEPEKTWESKSPQKKQKDTLDDYLELIISKDRLKAFIKIKKTVSSVVPIDTIREYLKTKKIKSGIKDDALIQTWLANADPGDDPFIIAEGVNPEFPQDAKIKYYFKTDFRKAGKIMDDGSIDFRDRGDIPFTKKDVLLAEKAIAVPGKPGLDIFGEPIIVPEPRDLAFDTGSGTRFSDDKLQIFADSEGMPHRDAMGNISVLPELTIKDDVDYKTGNLDFKGNIVVKGVVRTGFSVKCANLTAKQIEGAEVDLTGDLNVSAGIVDSELIRVQGSVQAKYINNSKINAFGDLIVQKEIIDSRVLLSGSCINETGNIINSYISAKKGVTAGSIGTDVSSPSKIKVGLNEHIEGLKEQAEEKIKKNIESIAKTKKEISECETEDRELYIKISKFAFIQDRAEIKLREIEKKLKALKASKNITALNKITDTVNKLHRNIKQAENKLNMAFTRQDILSEEISEKENKIQDYKTDNKELIQYKKNLKERSERDEAIAEVKVNRKIMSGTIIVGPNSTLTIKGTTSRCRIMELEVKEEEKGPVMYHKMDISSL